MPLYSTLISLTMKRLKIISCTEVLSNGILNLGFKDFKTAQKKALRY